MGIFPKWLESTGDDMSNHEVLITSGAHELEVAEYLHNGGFWMQSMKSSRDACSMLGAGVLLFGGVEYSEIESIDRDPFAISRKIEAMGIHKFSDRVMVEMMGMLRLEMYTEMTGYRDEPPYLQFDVDSSSRSLECARLYNDMTMRVLSGMLAKR